MSQPTAKELIAEATEQRKRKLYEPVLVRLFQTYDADESGLLEADEVRQIMLDCIEDERKVLSKNEVGQFMRVIGGEDVHEVNDDDLTITENHFVQFMMSGILKTKKQLQKFAKRSPMHKKLYVFMKHLMEDSESLERAEYQRNEASYRWFISMLWRKYDKDRSGAIDVEEMRELLIDAVKPTLEKQAASADSTGAGTLGVGKHLLSIEEVSAFMKSLDKNGNGSLEKEEFTKFVTESLQMTEEERVSFSTKSQLHEKLYMFLHSVFDHEDGPHKRAIDNAAAAIIQRAFRRYLNKKQDADLLNVVKAADEFNFDSLLQATIGGDEEAMDIDFDDELELSTGGGAYDAEDDFMVEETGGLDDEPDWLNQKRATDDYDSDATPMLDDGDTGFDDDDDDDDDDQRSKIKMKARARSMSGQQGGAEDPPPAPSGFEEKEFGMITFTDSNNEVDEMDRQRNAQRLKLLGDDFVWNYVGATLAKKLAQIQDLFSTLDESGDGLLSKSEFENALGKLGIHLDQKELEIMFHRMEVNESSHNAINFVQFHKSLHTAQRTMSMTRKDFTHCLNMLGIAVSTKDINGIYKRLCNETKPNVAHNIFFDSLQEEMYQLRNPLMRKILKKFCVKVQRTLQRLDASGQLAIISLRKKDVDLLSKRKEHEQISVMKRLQQALSKDPSKSARNTLSRILGTKKAETKSIDPVKWFLGDYVASLLLSTGMRVTELFSKLDSSGDGFLTHDELTRALKKMPIGKSMTRAELHVLHEIVDADGDGECSFKELRKRLEMTKDSRHITQRAFCEAMSELGFGDLQDEQYENIYNAVNVEGDGRVFFEDLHSTLHNTDEHGIPIAAKSGDPSGFDGVIPAAGTHDDKSAVPDWLANMKWGGDFTQFEHAKPKPGLESKNLPASIRKILKGHTLLTRRALMHLHNTGLMRITDMRRDHLKVLNSMPEPKRLEILEDLYEKLKTNRSKGGKPHELLANLLKLDDHRAKLSKSRRAKKVGSGKKGPNSALDGHAFSRNFVLAVLKTKGKGKVKHIITTIDEKSKTGGNWQKQVRDVLAASGVELTLNDVQLSLLRWVLEGMSWDLVKIGKAIKSMRPYGLIYDSQFSNALHLLGEHFDVEETETLYIRLTQKSGEGRISYSGLCTMLEDQRAEGQRVGMKVLEADDYGKNWADAMDAKKPLWLKVESEEVQRAKAVRRKGRNNRTWGGDANTMLYERSQRGHTKFGGSVYGPRLVDQMDEFTKASVKAGVNPKTVNRIVLHHNHKHAKSGNEKKKKNGKVRV
jgi:Ca2+-binding EF-hand superfamily protein